MSIDIAAGMRCAVVASAQQQMRVVYVISTTDEGDSTQTCLHYAVVDGPFYGPAFVSQRRL